MTDREWIKKLNQESKKFRLKAKTLEADQAAVTGTALLVEFSSAVSMRGLLLERAIFTCDMAMNMAAASVVGCQFAKEHKGESNKDAQAMSRKLFRDAAELQKALIPFIETHFKFSEDAKSHFNPTAVSDYLKEMERVEPLLSRAESLNDYCTDQRNTFAGRYAIETNSHS
jgi:hypothetical protein